MAKQLFKGFKQVLSGETFENGYIYLVREDAAKENGYIYFNGKKYGTTKAVADELIRLSNAVSAETEAREAAISALTGQLTAETAAREAAISGLQEEIMTEVSALTCEDVVDVRYDSSAKTIYMEFKDGSVSSGFDASAFIIDGMLSDVTYDSTAHTMTFIWNTDAGHQDITVDLDDVIAPYNADETTIHKGDNNTFSAIMDQAGGVASHSALTAETAAREAAISGLTDQLSAETAAREAAISGLTDQLSAETAAREAAIEALDANVSGSSNDVVVELTEVNGVITNITVTAPNAITELTVNEISAAISGHSASVVIDADDILLGADIPSGATSGQTVLEALTDIYEKLNESDAISSDNSINVTPGQENVDFTLNRETATDATVAAGHLEIALNASGETYAVMYYDGNDVA